MSKRRSRVVADRTLREHDRFVLKAVAGGCISQVAQRHALRAVAVQHLAEDHPGLGITLQSHQDDGEVVPSRGIIRGDGKDSP